MHHDPAIFGRERFGIRTTAVAFVDSQVESIGIWHL